MAITYIVKRCKPGQPLQSGYPRVQRYIKETDPLVGELVVLFTSEFSGPRLAFPLQELIGFTKTSTPGVWVSANDAATWEPCTIEIADGSLWTGPGAPVGVCKQEGA